jgi:ribosomal protein S12 methylthiotransferase
MRYFMDPFGCAKNQVDAETMLALLNDAGWIPSDDPGGADLIIVNSCGFIETAKQESINAVLAWKKQYPEKKIILAGCLTECCRAELKESLGEADGFLGCSDLDRIVKKADELFGTYYEKPDTVIRAGYRPLLSFPGSAYVKISEGCNNRCSFCTIPQIRGPLRCRSIPDIIRECKDLLTRGIKELCLIGQDLASFTQENPGQKNAMRISALAVLLEEIALLSGDFWVRLLYMHPDHFPLDILDLIVKDSRFLPYFDIPFQHASGRLLSLMGRSGDKTNYLRLLDTIRTRLPDAAIRSTFLTGFPGETEEDFAMLLNFQEQARFDWLGVFTWSREEGTAAYSMKHRISKKIAARRKILIEERQIPITEENMNRFVGRNMDILIEEEVKESGLWLGRLFCQAPEVDGATVIHGDGVITDNFPQGLLKLGGIIRGTVLARAGFDLEAGLCKLIPPDRLS